VAVEVVEDIQVLELMLGVQTLVVVEVDPVDVVLVVVVALV
tara:strand:+ start:389 stop:511 length:123 start_codon:yes stop_codon:yes gene_type:complete